MLPVSEQNCNGEKHPFLTLFSISPQLSYKSKPFPGNCLTSAVLFHIPLQPFIGTAHELRALCSFVLFLQGFSFCQPLCQLFYQDRHSGILMDCYLTLILSDYTKTKTLLASQDKVWMVSWWFTIHFLMRDIHQFSGVCWALFLAINLSTQQGIKIESVYLNSPSWSNCDWKGRDFYSTVLENISVCRWPENQITICKIVSQSFCNVPEEASWIRLEITFKKKQVRNVKNVF